MKRGRLQRSFRQLGRQPELPFFLLLLLLINAPLIVGQPPMGALLFPGAVADGDWWRLLTHPWAHVSGYHLALDAGAFLLLYRALDGHSLGRLAACAAGSLAAAWLAAPEIATIGFGGLSGIGHGLMGLLALQMMDPKQPGPVRRAGLLALIGVTLKAGIEAAVGHVLFFNWHPGSVGTPIVVCHAGGLLGGLLGAVLATYGRTRTVSSSAGIAKEITAVSAP